MAEGGNTTFSAEAEADAGRPPPRFCLTASEAYPILERWFLEAETEIVASFRIFDPSTRLRTEAAREVGVDWFDLIAATLRRGVRIVIYVSDFDPIAAHSLHRETWSSIRMLLGAAEVAGSEVSLLTVVPAPHPAQVGLLPRLILLPRALKELWKRTRELNAMAPGPRRTALRDMPGLAGYFAIGDDGVRPRPTLPQITPTTHHQKVAVFDRTRLSVGGLDLNERRWDSQRHDQPAEGTWHDVQSFLVDPIRAEAAARHILTLQRTTGGLIPPESRPGLIRTLSRRRSWNVARLSPAPLVREITRSHRLRIAESTRLIYLETQFFRDLKTAARLARAGRRNPDLQLIIVVPAAPEDVAFEGGRGADARFGEFLQARCIRLVRRAFGSRVLIVSPARPARSDSTGRDALWGAQIVYVHAKVSIFDDSAAIVSSANLNGRSLYWDTELGVEFTDRDDVARLRRQCWEHWLPEGADERFHDAATALRAWRALALDNLHSDPEARRGFLLPYDPTPAERFGRDLPAVPNEIV
jgi:phospholipase D1/2